MITIQSGKMMIPEEERFVGFAGDDQSNTKQFILPQTQITDVDAVFSLYLRFDDDRVTSAPLSVSIVGSDTILTWTIRAEHLLRPGIVMAQIKHTAGNGVVTHYSWDYFVVGASAQFADDGSEIDILSRTEFEERMAQAVRDARATAPYIGNDGYWYIYSREQGDYVRSFMANGTMVDSSVSESSANPVENRAVKAYVDAADAAKVDRSTRIAGIALSGNISAAELYQNMSGNINPPLVTIGVSAGMPAQYGKTPDGVPVFCRGLSQWVPLARADDIPEKTSDLNNDAGFLTEHQDITGKMDRLQRINSADQVSSLARDQFFECQGVVGFTGHSAGDGYTLLAKQDFAASINGSVESIKSYLGYWDSMDSDIVGLQVDFANKTFTRIAAAKNHSAGSFFDQYRMYGGRRRCNVADDGTINAYYGDAGYKDDGTNGQVMVYQPAFWYRVVPLKLEKNTAGLGYHIRKANYYVSAAPKPGFKLHPLFYDASGKPVDYVLLSAYEGSMYDVSESAYVNDSVDTTVSYGTGDLLCSAAGKKPISGKLDGIGTKAQFETMANNLGPGWHLNTIKAENANQLLMMIELGTLNTQTAIGRGVVDQSGSSNASSLTGSTASLGNATGMASSTIAESAGTETTNTTNGKLSVSYRGVENPWGNIWKHTNGINLWGDGTMGGGQVFICDDFTYNETKHDGNYQSAGFSAANANGYVSAFGYGSEDYDWVMMPSETDGNSSLPVGDNFYAASDINGYRIARLGGYWSSSDNAGGFSWACNAASNRRNYDIGGRLLYVPTSQI